MATYFTLSELLRSDTAAARSIDNAPSHDVIRRLNALMDECLDPVRELWGKPIGVNSGYRSPALNAAVGGAAASQHMKGEAADITTPSTSSSTRIGATGSIFHTVPTGRTEGRCCICEE